MRYVLLKHVNELEFHVDFLLDCGGDRLLSWQISDKNSIETLLQVGNIFDFTRPSSGIINKVPLVCRRNFDHRLIYLDFSGDLGDHRGCVTRIECGIWEITEPVSGRLVIKTTGMLLPDNIPTAKQWQLEPPGGLAINERELSPDRLMEMLPPPGEKVWRFWMLPLFSGKTLGYGNGF